MTTIFTTETSGGTRPDTSASATASRPPDRRHLGAPVDERTAALFTTLGPRLVQVLEHGPETLPSRRSWWSGAQPAAVGVDFSSVRIARWVDAQRTLARTSYYADGALAVIDLLLQPDGTPLDVDGDGVLDVLRAVESVEVALLLRAIEPALCKLSARSKGPFDVQRLAAGFGGGGHVKAAGATLEGAITAARQALVEAALAQMSDSGSSGGGARA